MHQSTIVMHLSRATSKSSPRKLSSLSIHGIGVAGVVGILIIPIIVAQSVEPLVTPQIIPFNNTEDSGNLNKGGETEIELGFSTPSNADPGGAATVEDGIDPLPGDLIDPPSEDAVGISGTAGDHGYVLESTDMGESDSWIDIAAAGPTLNHDADNTRMPALSHRSLGFNDGWPSGFAYPVGSPTVHDDVFNSLRDGLTTAVTFGGTYDTNPSQGITTTRNSGQGDFLTTLGGNLSYRSIAPVWTVGLSYSGNYSVFLNHSNLNGYEQRAVASLNYDSGPLTASLELRVDDGSGVNRYYASIVDEIRYGYTLSARYRYSPKTSLTGSLAQRITDATGRPGTGLLDLSSSALWRYSPLTEFGPGIRYTQRSGGSRQNLTSIGPTFTVNYQLAKKVSLNARAGMDFMSYENGGSANPSYTSSIGLDYRATSYWGMSLSLLRDVQASPDRNDQFEEITAMRLGYSRNIRRAILNVGIGWETRTSENFNNTVVSHPDRDYLTIDTSLGMPFFDGTTNASIFVRYLDHRGGPNESWNSVQFGFNIIHNF